MKHRASVRFWQCYHALPREIQRLADKCYDLLRRDPHHPSLHLKQVGRFWSVRVGLHHRALGVEHEDTIIWFWIGTHADYDNLINRQ